VWIDAKLMTYWFARNDKMPPARVGDINPRAGGKYLVEVDSPDGKTYRLQGIYREVQPPERLVFTWWYEQADFKNPQISVEFFAAGPDTTEVVLTHELLPEKEREPHRKGWEECFNMLERTLRCEFGSV
jgi:glutathione S-transferase